MNTLNCIASVFAVCWIAVGCGGSEQSDSDQSENITASTTGAVKCDFIYMSDMDDPSTLQDMGAKSIPMKSPKTANVSKTIKSFVATASAVPLVEDVDNFSHGFEVEIQITNGDATSYSSSHANSDEKFRRISG